METEKEFYFLRSGGRPELLFCMQGAELNAVESDTNFFLLYNKQKTTFYTVYWYRKILTVEMLPGGCWVKTAGLGDGSTTFLPQKLRYQIILELSPLIQGSSAV